MPNGGFIGKKNNTTSLVASGNFSVSENHLNVLNGTFPVYSSTYSNNIISRSLRFNSADSAYLNRTPGSSGNTRTWTWSGWVKRSKFNSGNALFSTVNGSAFNYFSFGTGGGGDQIQFAYYNGSTDIFNVSTGSTASFRDPAAWYHIVLSVDTTQATSSNRIKIYFNGVEQSIGGVYPTQNYDTPINGTISHIIGGGTGSYTNYLFNGLITEVHFIDGQALTPSSFGQISSYTGVWEPKTYTGTYGTNGFRLQFADNSGITASTLGKDTSGNGNNWTPNNFSVTAGTDNDSLIDTPSSYGTDTGAGGEVRGNYAVLNSLMQNTSVATLSNGNLQGTTGTTGISSAYMGTIGFNSGKWYFEVYVGAIGTNNMWIGISKNQTYRTVDAYTNTWTYNKLGQKTDNSATGSAYGSSYTTGDTIGVAVDADNGSITFYKNGVSQGVAFSGLNMTGGVYTIAGSDNSATMIFNFGQRPFASTAPAGFKALCTTNFATPSIVQGGIAFNALTYTGNGGTQNITTLGFQPDFVWIKRRDSNWSHAVYDSIRGAGSLKALSTNSTDAEGVFNADTTYGYLSAFNSNGFTVINGATGGYTNLNNATYVAWCLNAGGSSVTNTSGTITSTVRSNQEAGISIIGYTGNGSGGATIGHGLGNVPKMMIVRDRNNTNDWVMYHVSVGNGTVLVPNSQSGTVTPSSGYWNNTTPNSTTFTVGTTTNVNGSSRAYIAYCFTNISGFSEFGSYSGNGGGTNGVFVYTGFRPRFLLLKSSSNTTEWLMLDVTRNTYNPANLRIDMNSSAAEQTATYLDILSNGFKLNNSFSWMNDSGYTFIYAAFAESPFKYALAR